MKSELQYKNMQIDKKKMTSNFVYLQVCLIFLQLFALKKILLTIFGQCFVSFKLYWTVFRGS